MKKKSGNKKSFISKCPLAILVIVSVVLVTAVGAVGMATGLFSQKWSWEHPALEAVLLGGGETEATLPSSNEGTSSVPQPSAASPEQGSSREQPSQPSQSAPAQSADETTGSDVQPTDGPQVLPTVTIPEETTTEAAPVQGGRIPRPMAYADREPVVVRHLGYYDDPQKTPLTKPYDYITGDDAYFSDALFIGDSRTQGIYYYGDLVTATYAYLEGATLYSFLNQEMEVSRSGKMTIEQLLAEREFTKIYIMFGLNELGDRTSEEYGRICADAVERIKAMEPRAVVTLMGSMPISTEKSDASDWRNNDNINSRNYWSAFYCCDGTDVFYLDNNIPEFLDERGGLRPDYTNDGIHLQAQHYVTLCRNIREHALQPDMWN